MTISNKRENPHLVFLPSGIVDSTPFFRLAVVMASRNCKVTFINIQDQAIEPDFANEQGVELLDFEMQAEASSEATMRDPFIAQVATINRSLCQLIPILTSLQVSAMISDFSVAATLARISEDLNFPLYLVSTTSAKFFNVVANIPLLLSQDSEVFSNPSGEIEVQGMQSMPKSYIPSAWLQNSSTNHLLNEYLLPNASALSKVKGVFFNTFDWFEQDMFSQATNIQPPWLFPVGPLPNYQQQKGNHLPWLSEQPAQTVVYVNFGSREVMSSEQIKELKKGLEVSGYSYLWATHGNSSGASEVFSDESCSERGGKGVIVRGGVDQERVLADPAVGVFVSQCEWQSIMQAAWQGVPILAWPQHGDQKMNAEAVEKNGLGIWMKGRRGEEVVDGDDIGRLVRQMMEDLDIKNGAKSVRERATVACENGGTSRKAFDKFLQMLASNKY